MTDDQNKPEGWINEIEIANAQVKWGFSHFDGREDTFNAEGDHNFTVILSEADAIDLMKKGWNIREIPGYEEGDPSEFLLKVKISFKFEDPKMFLIKDNRKFHCRKDDLRDIKRATCENLDIIIVPYKWTHGRDSGVTAYIKELYATVSQSRFASQYDDLEIAG